jgi:glycoprotein-N-acetylgalactosamine 3-beta-galactosyltransferase
MLSLNNKKSFISIGIIVAGILLITILYITSSTNNYSINTFKIKFPRNENHSHTLSTRVLCLILTSPQNFLTRAKAVNETWAPRCNGYFFITEHIPKSLTHEQLKFTEQVPIAPIKNITPGYEHLTQKSTLAFLFAYENYLNDFDWFVKADDDTYLFVDNLKTFLSEQNSSEPVTFGYNFKVIINDPLLSA